VTLDFDPTNTVKRVFILKHVVISNSIRNRTRVKVTKGINLAISISHITRNLQSNILFNSSINNAIDLITIAKGKRTSKGHQVTLLLRLHIRSTGYTDATISSSN